MNPLRDAAIWAVELLPTSAPEWLVGTTVFVALVAALAAITIPPCLLIGYWISRRSR
ncbi:hypothetical protein [Halomonas elongata]|uniref:hypothetical protein n=1 Tax=Halomonas elongata TaxID=2746 RepID=UPI00186B7A85|nr:hypothetical protein [Halomonas elongata]MBW5800645.1 hypothetical protein [Halomonas elongata]